MISRQTNIMLRQFYKRLTWNCRSCSTIPIQPGERDPAPLFFDTNVQQLLKTLTRIDYKKVFRLRKDGRKLVPPMYKFLTDEELEQEMRRVKSKAKLYLQMPPVVKVREDKEKVISPDYGIDGFSNAKFVFTDITFGISNKNRLIAVREPNGILRHAYYSERDRLNQIYFPTPGKELSKPRMFDDEYLMGIIERGDYEFILDRACTQFDPDDPEYHRVTREVYCYINRTGKFDALRSTRHFGPMVFHFAWNNEIDNLLLEMIKTSRIDEAVLLLKLYHQIHPVAESSAGEFHDKDDIGMIKRYAKLSSIKRTSIEKAVLAYEELQKEKQKVAEGIKRAHGFDSAPDEKQIDK